MATEVSVRNLSTGDVDFYSTYADAYDNADSGDVISIYANLEEPIILKDEVDLYISPGTVLNASSVDEATIKDDGNACKCTITGGGIIKNGSAECITITNEDSVVNIECHSVENEGVSSGSVGGASVYVTGAKRFSLICDRVTNKYNTPLYIENCNDFFLKIRNVESGTPNDTNTGAPAMHINGSGSIYLNALKCTGYGSCLAHAGGNLAATIKRILTLPPISETPATIAPTILLDGGTGEQELVLYFEEIKNLNTQNGDAVRIAEGKASLTGKSIFSSNGLSLDFTNDVISALVQCDSIISLTKGINIANSDEQVVIIANYIEGSDGNDGVIKCNDTCNLYLRDANIVNTTESSLSVGIYITATEDPTQEILIENLIIVTGTSEDDYSIFRDGEENINIKNLLLFVKKGISDHITLLIGDENNFRYIEDINIQ
jgi:hypothetical protein